MRRGHHGSLLTAAAALAVVLAAPIAAQPPARNVVVITIDGLRWQEFFGGADRDYFKRDKNGDAGDPERRFWRADAGERRATLLPFVWNTMAARGQVFGDPAAGSESRLTNGLWFSYPGYNEMFAGVADPKIDSNAKVPNPNTTVLEWLNRRPGFAGRVAAFGSWDVLPSILNVERSGIIVGSGWKPVPAPATERGRAINELAADLPRLWGYGPPDAPIVYAAIEQLRTHRPRVLYVMLGEGDEWAHEGRYDLYLDAAQRADRFIERIWSVLQSMPEYRDRTALLVTTDHGRGATNKDWTNHGRDVPAADRTWMALLGAGVPQTGIRRDVNVTTSQVAATIAALLGEDFRAAVPAAAPPLPLRMSQSVPADVVLLNGTVITVDPRDSIAQAVAVKAGRIAFVGTTAEARKYVGKETRVIDLTGRTATPGLIDTHVHFSESADALDLGDARSMDEVIRKVRQRAAGVPAGTWVRGGGWDEGKLAERRYITAADLDKAAPDHPVYLTHTTGHYGVANSLALKLSGVTRETRDPPGGTIDRDTDGNPTGVMKERATGLIARGGGGGSGDRGNTMRADVLRIIEGFNREGMTGAKDLNVSQAKWDVYKQLLDEGKLNVRVAVLWRGGGTVESTRQAMKLIEGAPRVPATLGNGRLVSAGVKLYIDGSGGARTAWMYDDWNKDLTGTDTGNKGYPANGEGYPEVFKQQVTMLTEAGIHVGAHAVGDRGIDFVVDTFAEALKAHPVKGLRHSIIHANVPTDRAMRVMASLQTTYDAGYPEAQAPFLWWIGDTYAGNFGPKRNVRLEPFGSYLKHGVIWGGGSDYSVTPYPARYGLWSSVARETQAGTYGRTPFGATESIDVRTALKSYTIWAARQLFLDDQVGSLELGKQADIAVWDRNLYKVPAAQLKDLRCEMTLVAGAVVFERK